MKDLCLQLEVPCEHRHFLYHLGDRTWAENAARVSLSMGYTKIIVLNNPYFKNPGEKAVEACNTYIHYYMDVMRKLGLEVGLQRDSVINDFSTLFFSPAVFSTVRSTLTYRL